MDILILNSYSYKEIIKLLLKVDKFSNVI